ncbi:MAG: DUF4124 domain-containing protein [Pseudomonadales bacterium]
MRKLLLLAILLGFLVPVRAEVYKWVDENGKVHFGDRAPEDKKSESIDKQLNKVNIDHGSSAKPTRLAPQTEKTQDEKNLEIEKKKALEKAIGTQCKKWLLDIAAIERGDRGAFIGEDGKEEIVLERDRGTKLAEWKDDYRKSNCQKIYPLSR